MPRAISVRKARRLCEEVMAVRAVPWKRERKVKIERHVCGELLEPLDRVSKVQLTDV